MVKVIINSPAVPAGSVHSVFEKHDVTHTKDKAEYRNYEDSFRHDIVFNRE
jgi:hypothetical protein